ncbi:MAG TPA: FHA domain-containing protein [Kofleriaceae bacterium]|nr:FHA domain-containing protein [Kofleriaceae bacterium]
MVAAPPAARPDDAPSTHPGAGAVSGSSTPPRLAPQPRAAPEPASAIAPLILEREAGHGGLDMPPYVVDGPTRIGRVSLPALDQEFQRELVLPYTAVSRNHAVIVASAAGFVLKDVGSSNGTFVNDFRIGEFPIKSGDRVRLGDLRFMVRGVKPTGGGGDRDREITTPMPDQTPSVGLVMPLPTEVATLRRPDKAIGDWASVPGVESCAFGAIVIHGYDQVHEGMSEIGQQRLETSLGKLVAMRLDGDTYAFKSITASALQIVIVSRSAARIESLTLEIAAELKLWLADAAREHHDILWSTSLMDPAVAIRRARSMSVTAPTLPILEQPVEVTDELRWVHISDLHVGAGTQSWRYDHEQVTTSLARDLRRHPFAAHRVLVTGDVAFSGGTDQYERAFETLVRIGSAAGLPIASVRVVPGNHDIDRARARTPLTAALHHHARSSPVALDEMLADPRSRTVLLEKLQGYRAFIARLNGHPTELDWRERLTVAGARVDLWGLSSVWISDGQDGRRESGGFDANLIVGRAQYREITREPLVADVNVLMTHHPLDWVSAAHQCTLRSWAPKS